MQVCASSGAAPSRFETGASWLRRRNGALKRSTVLVACRTSPPERPGTWWAGTTRNTGATTTFGTPTPSLATQERWPSSWVSAMSALITIAACAHDVVYDARPGEDERHGSPRSVARELNRYRQGHRR
jgi:hypothetical protein